MGMGLSLAHAELQPQDREAMNKRLQQLKSLVGSRTIEAQMRAGNRLQAGYALDNRQKQAEEANALLGRRFIDRRAERGALDPGMWFHFDDGDHSSFASGATPHYSLRTPSGKASGKGGPVHRRRAGPSQFGGSSGASLISRSRRPTDASESGRSGVDSGYLPARK